MKKDYQVKNPADPLHRRAPVPDTRVVVGRRRLLVTAALGLIIAGCPGSKTSSPADRRSEDSSAATEKRLSLYTSYPADEYNALVEAFEKETGIKVDIVFGGTGEMMKRIDAEKAAPQADVMLGGSPDSFEVYRSAFAPYRVQQSDHIPADFKAADGLWHASHSLAMVLAYNKNLVKESDKPAGWAALAEPRWKGKLVMANAVKSDTAYTQLITILTRFGRDDGKGWAMIRSIVKNAVIVDSSSLVVQGVSSGEYAVGLATEVIVGRYIKPGSPLGIIYPVEGTAIMRDSNAMIKGAKHVRSAQVFLDWLYGNTGQAMLAKLGCRPVRAEVAPIILPTLDKLTLVQPDPQWAQAQRPTILATFRDLMTE